MKDFDMLADSLFEKANQRKCTVREIYDAHEDGSLSVRHRLQKDFFVEFILEDRSFFARFQPSANSAPLCVHLPGYCAEFSDFSAYADVGFNVLDINPLGYNTPSGYRDVLSEGDYPVLKNTLMCEGLTYTDWICDVITAVTWAQNKSTVIRDRISFFGTSQGGGMSLVMASLYRGRGVRCVCCDVPWLIGFSTSRFEYALSYAHGHCSDTYAAREAMALIDPENHTDRIDIPVLLTAGERDKYCPPVFARGLFDKLNTTKAFVWLKDCEHGFTEPFNRLAMSFFKLYC